MLKSRSNLKVICSFVCAAISLAILLMMFVPYWSYTGTDEDTFKPVDRKVSINGYLWFPSDHSELEVEFNEYSSSDEVDANDIALPIGLQILFGVFAVVVCIWKPKVTAVALLPIVCGLCGILGYLFVDVLRMASTGLWVTNLVLSILASVVGILMIVFGCMYKEDVERLHQA